MSGIAVLLGLLIVAYIGSMLVGGRTIRGFGLPSGAEYLVLGVVVGPGVLGLLPRSMVRSFEPIFVCAAAWLALVLGLGYLVVGHRRVKIGRALAGVVTATLVGGVVAGALWFALGKLNLLTGYPRLQLSLGAGFVGCETTRHTVRWVVERHGASGRLSDWLADMARASALVPMLGLGVLFALSPDSPLGAFTIPARLGTTAGLGVVMGLTVAVVSPHRLDIKMMVQPTEKPVLLPVVMVAGACVDFRAMPKIWILVGVALAARLAAELVRGVILVAFLPPARAAGPSIGLGMTSTGAVSLALAFTLAVRSPGPASNAVLVVAAAGVLLGELIGPAMLRRSLERAGETHAVEAMEPSPLSMPRGAFAHGDRDSVSGTPFSEPPRSG